MAYPTLEQYNEALQSPQYVLLDPILKQGKLKTTGLGLPLALCGGFALTYTIEAGGRKFALRCFHRESRELERRYQAISARLRQLGSPYFLPFEFIPNGIRIQGATYPIVKMEWAQGRTLAEFLESEHRNIRALQNLRQSLARLADFLERNQIAHGDIQPENLMVNADGSNVQLIDYDGMFVEALRGSTATEVGQLNFQHPRRSATDFNERLDRFSFLTLDVALHALASSPALWANSQSEPSAIVFRRNDFLAPGASTIFNDVAKLQGVATHARNLARVAAGDFQSIPTLADFLQDRGITGSAIIFNPKSSPAAIAYQGAYTVCDATKYAQVLALVGNRIELIGQIQSVRRGWGANKKPYIFVNFSDWRGDAVKLSIWSDGMKAIEPNVPDDSWVGRWLSVTGLVEPPFVSKGKGRSGGYSHLSITISAPSQLRQLNEAEARFRLRGGNAPSPTNSQNSDILRTMGTSPGRASAPAPPRRTAPPRSGNQQVLAAMQAQTPRTTASRPAQPPPQNSGGQSSPPAPSTGKGILGLALHALWRLLK